MNHNQDNLISLADRTTEEKRAIGIMGGKASGEARRKKKTMRQELEMLLEMLDKDGHTNQEKISMALLKKASTGDTRAFEVIRDTIGQKPVEVQQIQELPVIKDDI